MAVLEVKVPQLSESVTEATLLQWHKQAGEAVTLDENLVDVETDKVVLELPCPANGVLTQILKRDGSIVVAGEVIALVDTEAMASAESKPQEPQTREMELFASAPAAEPVAAVASAPVPVDPPAKPEKEEDLEIAAFDSERDMPDPADYPSGIVMPAAARMMAELGMDETSVVGTGKDGRITKKDVERAWEAQGTDLGEDEKAIEQATRRVAPPGRNALYAFRLDRTADGLRGDEPHGKPCPDEPFARTRCRAADPVTAADGLADDVQ